MYFKQSFTALGLLAGSLTFDAQAALTSCNPNGVELVYSGVSDITWTKDANLLGTLIADQGFNTVVNAIIAASPIIYDTPNSGDTPWYSGQYTVTGADFSSSDLGRTTWWGAQAFVSYLNSIEYGGSDQWRLPSAGDPPQWGYNQTGEFGQLFYSELGGTGGNNIPNTATFDNE